MIERTELRPDAGDDEHRFALRERLKAQSARREAQRCPRLAKARAKQVLAEHGISPARSGR